VPFNITITALDANDNTVLSFNGSANITSTGNLTTGGAASPNFSSGVLASLVVAISNSGTFTISATSGAAGGTSNAFVVGSIADLAVTMSGPAFTTAGGAPNYTINVTNNGPLNATGVSVALAIPSGWFILN